MTIDRTEVESLLPLAPKMARLSQLVRLARARGLTPELS